MGKIDYNNFDASSARQIAKEGQKPEWQKILDKIKEAVEENPKVSAIGHQILDAETRAILKEKGFYISSLSKNTLIGW